MNKKFFRLPISSKIAKEMCLRLTLIVLLPVSVVGIFLVKYSVNVLYKRAMEQIAADSLRVNSLLTDSFIHIFHLSDEILNDAALMDYLMADEDDGLLFPETVYTRIRSILVTNTAISSISIYTANPYREEGTYIHYAQDTVMEECFQHANIPASAVWGLYPSVNSNKDNPELTLVRSFPLRDSRYPAILVITLSSNYLRNRIQNNSLSTMLSINDSHIFFSTIRSLQESPMPADIDYSKKYYQKEGLFQFYGEKVLGHIAAVPIYNTNDILYICTLDLNARKQIITVSIVNSLITFSVIVAALLGMILYTGYLSRRIINLRTSMKLVRNGSYDDIIESLKGDDELSETFEDLKLLIEEIKQKEALMFEIRLKEQQLISEQNDMKYKLLRSQINPHFIYNTLETIRMLALDADAPRAAESALLLARAMRYVLDNSMGNTTTLEKELSYIDSYLQLQQIRFEDRLEYEIRTDSAICTSDCLILPMLLQPIVENAVIHGSEAVARKVKISILAEKKDNSLQICICDNGKGIKPDILEWLETSPEQTSGRGIGLSNIRSRIKLCYGDSFGITIQSTDGRGTSVTLKLPFMEAGQS